MMDIKVLFLGNESCEKERWITTYFSGFFPESGSQNPRTVSVKKAMGPRKKSAKQPGDSPKTVEIDLKNQSDSDPDVSLLDKRKKLKLSITLHSTGDDTADHWGYYPNKNIYVFVFSFQDPQSFTDLFDKWLPDIHKGHPEYEEKQCVRVLLGVDAQHKDETFFTPRYLRNVATAMNVHGYFEMKTEDSQSVITVMDNIIKLYLAFKKKEGKTTTYYSPSLVEGLIGIEEYPHPYVWGKIIVTVIKANGIDPKDLNGKSDPYCKFGWSEAMDKEMKNTHETKRKKETIDPEWNADDNNSKIFNLVGNCSKFRNFKLQVWDHDLTSRDDFEGEVNLPLLEMLNPTKSQLTAELTQKMESKDKNSKVSGTVTFEWKFKP
eukprot:TRINITY_DN4812_c0_g1_i1.p1 TRINITY_DN4812_c0_g1~~TRINITY_DN4812_c0_g1_i1.p1  ORF type:complete len:377 (+),score=72.78 TRINITY_DN4812_c0_g1_i1:79-1209(+)